MTERERRSERLDVISTFCCSDERIRKRGEFRMKSKLFDDASLRVLQIHQRRSSPHFNLDMLSRNLQPEKLVSYDERYDSYRS